MNLLLKKTTLNISIIFKIFSIFVIQFTLNAPKAAVQNSERSFSSPNFKMIWLTEKNAQNGYYPLKKLSTSDFEIESDYPLANSKTNSEMIVSFKPRTLVTSDIGWYDIIGNDESKLQILSVEKKGRTNQQISEFYLKHCSIRKVDRPNPNDHVYKSLDVDGVTWEYSEWGAFYYSNIRFGSNPIEGQYDAYRCIVYLRELTEAKVLVILQNWNILFQGFVKDPPNNQMYLAFNQEVVKDVLIPQNLKEILPTLKSVRVK